MMKKILVCIAFFSLFFVFLALFGCAEKTQISQEVIFSEQDANSNTNLLEEYKENVPNDVILDYLYADMNHDGVDDLVVAFCSFDQNEIREYNGFAVLAAGYPCASFSMDNGEWQYLKGTLKINEKGNIVFTSYVPSSGLFLEIELQFEIADNHSVGYTALSGKTFKLIATG